MSKLSATLREMNCAECSTKLRSDSIQCFKRVNGKPQRVCNKCFDAPRHEVDIPIKGDIISDKLLGNKVKWKE